MRLKKMNYYFIVAAIAGFVFVVFCVMGCVYNKKNSDSAVPAAEKHSAVQDPEESKSSDVKRNELTGKDKGIIFEKFVVGLFDKSKHFSDVRLVSDRIGEDNRVPDILLTCKLDVNHDLAIQCKYRSSIKDGFEFSAEDYKWHKDYEENNKCPVSIFLGVGGINNKGDEKPKTMYVIPLKFFKDREKISPEELKSYEVGTTRPYYDPKGGFCKWPTNYQKQSR
jgi:hypothetical protein